MLKFRRIQFHLFTALVNRGLFVAFVLASLILGCGPRLMAGEEHENPVWPQLRLGESIADYAKRVGLPATRECQLDKNIRLEAVLIPAGKFKMGSPETEEGRRENETQHEVTISRPFYMGKFLVTQEQYNAVMNSNPSNVVAKENPVETVTWKDAQEFCKRATKRDAIVRLPTEAEWEYACRAGTITPYNTGNDINSSEANYTTIASAKGRTASQTEDPKPVGSFPPNGWGLFDMHGNVLEWCSDSYDADYYDNKPVTDPSGPADGNLKAKVLRGGSSQLCKPYLRSAFRSALSADDKASDTGFRIVVSVSMDAPVERDDEKLLSK